MDFVEEIPLPIICRLLNFEDYILELSVFVVQCRWKDLCEAPCTFKLSNKKFFASKLYNSSWLNWRNFLIITLCKLAVLIRRSNHKIQDLAGLRDFWKIPTLRGPVFIADWNPRWPKIFFAIFSHLFCKIHVLGSRQKSWRDFWKIPTLRGVVLIYDWYPRWPKIFFAIFLQPFCKIHILAYGQYSSRDFWTSRGMIMIKISES